MPYCVKPLGNNRYVILNRDYRPLGLSHGPSLPEAEYQELLEKYEVRIIETELLQSLHWDDCQRSDGWIFLYKDENSPKTSKKNKRAYLKKCGILERLTGVKFITQELGEQV